MVEGVDHGYDTLCDCKMEQMTLGNRLNPSGDLVPGVDSQRRTDRWLGTPISRKSYLVGLAAVLGASYSQYLFGGLGPILGMLLVYGVPILVTGLLWGRAIIHKAFSRKRDAIKFGLGLFGALSVLSIFVSNALLVIISNFDPQAVSLLNKPNPVLNVSPDLAWVMVAVSIVIVGPAEEYLFRGFVYGGLLSIFKGKHWIGLAFVSSVIFGAAHLYYAIVYGVTSLLPFTDLVTFGMAMAITYYLSGGNLVIPAVIHGVYDASGFISVASPSGLGILLRWGMTIIGILVAIFLFVKRVRRRTRHAKDLGVQPIV
jgi:membrane protease YdiL (CAAX protease family)